MGGECKVEKFQFHREYYIQTELKREGVKVRIGVENSTTGAPQEGRNWGGKISKGIY